MSLPKHDLRIYLDADTRAAAEIITEGVFASREFVAGAMETMSFRVRQQVAQARENFETVAQRMARAHPQRRLDELAPGYVQRRALSWGYYWDVVGHCKVYDYKRRQWQAFPRAATDVAREAGSSQ